MWSSRELVHDHLADLLAGDLSHPRLIERRLYAIDGRFQSAEGKGPLLARLSYAQQQLLACNLLAPPVLLPTSRPVT
jgi:hypothetical protein